MQALKGALVGMPAERRNGGLLGWGTSLVGGSSEVGRGSDWAIMRGLALCGDGAGPQACYSVHHNAAPGLGLHGPGVPVFPTLFPTVAPLTSLHKAPGLLLYPPHMPHLG